MSDKQLNNLEGHLVLYDGVCGLCNKLNQFILTRDKEVKFSFAALQSDYAKKLLTEYKLTDETETIYVFPKGNKPPLTKGRAIVFILEELGWPWKVAGFFRVLPTWFLNRGYDIIAKNRYALFGRQDYCVLPTKEVKRKEIDKKT